MQCLPQENRLFWPSPTVTVLCVWDCGLKGRKAGNTTPVRQCMCLLGVGFFFKCVFHFRKSQMFICSQLPGSTRGSFYRHPGYLSSSRPINILKWMLCLKSFVALFSRGPALVKYKTAGDGSFCTSNGCRLVKTEVGEGLPNWFPPCWWVDIVTDVVETPLESVRSSFAWAMSMRLNLLLSISLHNVLSFRNNNVCSSWLPCVRALEEPVS